MKGCKSQTQCENISKGKRGKSQGQLSEDHKKNISESNKGKLKLSGYTLTEEHKHMISKSQIGMKRSSEAIKNMKLAQQNRSNKEKELGIIRHPTNIGYKHTNESKLKISESNKRRKGKPKSEEWKQKIRDTFQRKRELKIS